MSPTVAAQPPVALTLRLYRALARSFPQEFQNIYGEDLLRDAEDMVEPVWRRHGIAGLIRLLLDIAVRVPAEYFAEFRRDVRQGVRILKASPGFTLVALVSLILGIGTASAAYSEFKAVLRDLPGVRNPGELIAVQAPVSYPAYTRHRELRDLFSQTLAYVPAVRMVVSLGAGKERSWGHLVTPSYFATFGLKPHLGRFFHAGDDQTGVSPAVVVSYRFWEEHLGSDPLAVGKVLRINSHPCTVVGVGPEQFQGASPAAYVADLWLPVHSGLAVAPEMEPGSLERRDLAMFQMVARLRPGVSHAAAEAALTASARQFAEFYGDLGRHEKQPYMAVVEGGKVVPLSRQMIPFFRQFQIILGSLLLLIACANVATMMLARAAGRRREIAIRLSVGASRGRLIRQLLTESLLLSAGAALPAYAFAWWAMDLFSRLRMPFPIPVSVDFRPDWRTLVFAFLVTGVTGILFGLAPALQAARTDLVTTLKEGGLRRPRRIRALSLRNALVLGQMAASLTLLLISGFMSLGFQSTVGVQEGFTARNLHILSLDPVRDGYPPERAGRFLEDLLDRVKRLPGVTSACLTETLPAALEGNAGVMIAVEGPATGESREWARRHTVGRGYFETTGIPILSGRAFRRQDEAEDAAGVVVSQEAVRRIWKGENPVGRRVRFANAAAKGAIGFWPGSFDNRAGTLARADRTFEVIGVAGDVTEDIITSKKRPAVYLPLRPPDHARPSLAGVTLLLRARPGVDVFRLVRAELSAMDSRVTAHDARTMTEHLSQFMAIIRSTSWSYVVMGFSGLILAAVGLAGVTANSVAKRAHEIGIRMALGAQKSQVLRLVMREGAALVILGTIFGLLMALGAIRALSAMFFTVASVQRYEPALLIGAPALLAALALVACYLPARRATRVDPVVTLRME